MNYEFAPIGSYASIPYDRLDPLVDAALSVTYAHITGGRTSSYICIDPIEDEVMPPIVVLGGLNSHLTDADTAADGAYQVCCAAVANPRSRVFGIDLPGHGSGSKLTGSQIWSMLQNKSFSALAEQVNEVIESLRLKEVNVLALSTGGLIAATMMAQNPDGFKSMFCVEPAGTKKRNPIALYKDLVIPGSKDQKNAQCKFLEENKLLSDNRFRELPPFERYKLLFELRHRGEKKPNFAFYRRNRLAALSSLLRTPNAETKLLPELTTALKANPHLRAKLRVGEHSRISNLLQLTTDLSCYPQDIHRRLILEEVAGFNHDLAGVHMAPVTAAESAKFFAIAA